MTHLVDLDDGTVIATVDERSAIVLLKALEAQGATWRAGITQVAIDPFTLAEGTTITGTVCSTLPSSRRASSPAGAGRPSPAPDAVTPTHRS